MIVTKQGRLLEAFKNGDRESCQQIAKAALKV